MFRNLLVAGALLLQAIAATAETSGGITATLEGEARTWHVTTETVGGKPMSQSDWEPMSPAFATVSLLGHPGPTGMNSIGALSIGFTLIGSGADMTVAEPEVIFFYEGFTNAYSSSEGGEARIELTEVAMDGDVLTVAGTFSGKLAHFALGGGAPMGGKTKLVVADGVFEAVVDVIRD